MCSEIRKGESENKGINEWSGECEENQTNHVLVLMGYFNYAVYLSLMDLQCGPSTYIDNILIHNITLTSFIFLRRFDLIR